MNLAIPRIEGSEEALGKFCHQLNVHADSVWKTGNRRRGGRFHVSCGISVKLADADNPRAIGMSLATYPTADEANGTQISGSAREKE